MHNHCFNRLFEWMTALMMVVIAIIVAINPKTVEFGGFYLMRDIGLTATWLGTLFMLGGCLRIAALFANGHWPVYGPRFRAACALMGAVIWMQMLLALTAWSTKSGYISIGVAVYFFLTVGELISCYRAAADVRNVSR